MSRLHGLWRRICFQTRRPYTSYHAAIPLHLLPHCSKLLLMEEIQLTTWEIKQHVNNGIDYQPQLAHDFFHQQYLLMRIWKIHQNAWLYLTIIPGWFKALPKSTQLLRSFFFFRLVVLLTGLSTSFSGSMLIFQGVMVLVGNVEDFY